MKQIFAAGAEKSYTKVVTAEDVATFESGTVHEVYATFAIARDAEWAGRLFVLDMKEDDEEGIGTFVLVDHHAPALVGETVVYEAVIDELHKNIIGCTFAAYVGHRLIASGRTGQKILKKDKLQSIMADLSQGL
jgi:fluoroacetyl-CoA thioesterase